MKRFLITTKGGKTIQIKDSSPFKVSNKIKAAGAQPTLVLEV